MARGNASDCKKQDQICGIACECHIRGYVSCESEFSVTKRHLQVVGCVVLKKSLTCHANSAQGFSRTYLLCRV